MTPLILDIETGPRPVAEIEPLLPVITAPANYKDAEKIRAYTDQRRAELIRDAALDASLGRILCIGLLSSNGESRFIHDDTSEAALLRQFWTALESKRADEVFVTFNGSRFDWPFLFRRSLACGVAVPEWFPRDGRWPRRTHIDLLEAWQCGDRSETISLDRFARLLGLPGKSGSGAEFGLLWYSDRIRALEYLTHDLRLTLAIFERLHPRHTTPARHDEAA